MTQHITAASLRKLGRPTQLRDGLYVYAFHTPFRVLDSVFSRCVVNTPVLPSTGLGYSVDALNGLIGEIIQAFGLPRLQDVSQLSSLQCPFSDWKKRYILRPGVYTHSRFEHSLDVLALAMVIAHQRIKLGENLVLCIAALTHDALTAANGDTTKRIDPPKFDEDHRYKELLSRDQVRALCKRHGVDTDLLYRTIKGEGPLGGILDLADKIAYTVRDVASCTGMPSLWPESVYGKGRRASEYKTLHRMVRRDPNFGTLWDAVSIIADNLVVTDSRRLALFLEIRARMFRDFYLHPAARGGYHLIMEVLTSYLYEGGKLSRDQLISMRDYELYQLIADAFGGWEAVGQSFFTQAESRVEFFENLKQAQARERELLRSGIAFVRAEHVGLCCNPATDILVLENGQVFPFRDVRAEAANRIEQIARTPQPIRVYFITGDTLPERYRNAIIKSRLTQLRQTAQ